MKRSIFHVSALGFMFALMAALLAGGCGGSPDAIPSDGVSNNTDGGAELLR